MYSVIIVDDEPWGLVGTRNAFHWNLHGFEIVAEFTNSEEACDYIRNNRPDVVFTDIRMPKYSGIDLTRMAREAGIDTEFVIISGFAEFSYAQEALKFGALDYCLKPIDIEKTDELLDKVYQHVHKKNRIIGNSILEALISNDQKELARYRSIIFKSPGKFWYAVIMYTKIENDSIIKPELISEFTNGEKFLGVKVGSGKMLYIVNSDEEIVFRADMFKEFLKYGILSIGSSRKENSLKNPEKLIKEADMAALKTFVTGREGLFYYEDNTKAVKPLVKALQNAVETRNYEEIYGMLENLKKEFIVNQLGMTEVVYLWNQIISPIINNYIEEDCCSGLEYLNYSELSHRFADFESLCSFLLEVFMTLEQQYDVSMNEKEIIHYFEQLVKYIDEHYDQELYLKDLSARFYLNQFYCCKLFKKILGKTFSEYVLSVRINRACQLIKNTTLSIEEIALKVGYVDYFYFNKVFKKQCGITPAKYRKE